MATGSYLLERYTSGSWVTIAAGSVLSVSGSWAVSGNEQNAVAFGDDTDADLRAELLLSEWALLPHLNPIRYTTTIDADTTRTFTGVVSERSRDLDKMSLSASGMKALIAATKSYSPAFARRPVATKTTATSVEDPADGAYAGGLINYGLWQAGGRPYEQAATYTAAPFYYSCDHAVLAPDWSWLAGEDTWQECCRLAKDSGGQMYQDASGVVRYKRVLGYGGVSTSDTLTESDYLTVEQTEDPGVVYATKVTCQYVPRRRLGTQEIADDTTPHHVEDGETVTIVIEPQNPIASLEVASAGQLASTALVIAQLDGSLVAQGASGYTHTLDVAAARITIDITNASGAPFMVWRVKLRGDPIVAGEAGSVSSGSGTVERVLEQTPYIQSRTAAQRLADMTLAFYASVRPTVRASGCVHKPSRAVGGAVNLTVGNWSMSASKHVILEISHSETGAQQDLTLAYVEDLPSVASFFVVGTTYSGSDTKYLGW
jgi:hypothetical protein